MANNTKYKEVTTVGPIEWARIFEHNRDMEGYEGAYADCEGAYTVTQILAKEQYEKLKKAGSMKKPILSRMTDGVIAIKFERKHLVKTKAGDVVEKAGGPPKVTKADGSFWEPDTDGLIGNGTVAEITHLIQTFPVKDQKTGKDSIASRTAIQKIKIVEHVAYERKEDAE